jgi:DNA polymerase sigma
MDRKPDKQTLTLLKKHLKYLRKRFKPQKILLFGSRARGDHFEESDIDLLIISEQFKELDWRERIIEAFGPWQDKVMLSPICITPEEFEHKKQELGIVAQAVEEGIELS